jgi:hypothetical protein
MKIKTINVHRLGMAEIILLFKDVKFGQVLKMKTPRGWIMNVGGLLQMEKDKVLYVADKGVWRKMWDL